MIPFGADVHWSVTEADGSRVVGEGDTTLSAYGGWEAEWRIPDKGEARELRDSLPRCRARLRRRNADQRSGVSRSAVFGDCRSDDTRGRHNSACPDFLRIFSWCAERSARVCTGKRLGTTYAEFGSEVEGAYRKRFNSYAEVGHATWILTVRRSKPSKETRNSMCMVSSRSCANRRSKTIPPSVARM